MTLSELIQKAREVGEKADTPYVPTVELYTKEEMIEIASNRAEFSRFARNHWTEIIKHLEALEEKTQAIKDAREIVELKIKCGHGSICFTGSFSSCFCGFDEAQEWLKKYGGGE